MGVLLLGHRAVLLLVDGRERMNTRYAWIAVPWVMHFMDIGVLEVALCEQHVTGGEQAWDHAHAGFGARDRLR